MSRTMQVAGVMTAGYVLGRFRKLRMAVLVGSALVNKKVRDSSLGLIQQQAGKLTGSPEMGKLGQQLSQGLVQSGKSAALAVAARRMDAMSARLDEQSHGLRTQGEDDDQDDQDADAQERRRDRDSEQDSAVQEEEQEDEAADDDEEYDEDDDELQDEYDEDSEEAGDEEEEDEEEDEKPTRSRSRRGKAQEGDGE